MTKPPFFTTPEREAALQAEVASWLGTPFVDGIGTRAKKRTACDCVSWVAAALQAVGAIGRVPWPKNYVSCTGGPDMLDILLTTMAATERLELVWTGDVADRPAVMVGDILGGSTGRAAHHLALYMGDNHIVHCWDGCVREGNVFDSMLTKHMHWIWRAHV